MRRLVWWLRSAFCSHDWKQIGVVTIYTMDEDGRQLGSLPTGQKIIKECQKCGWLWTQRT